MKIHLDENSNLNFVDSNEVKVQFYFKKMIEDGYGWYVTKDDMFGIVHLHSKVEMTEEELQELQDYEFDPEFYEVKNTETHDRSVSRASFRLVKKNEDGTNSSLFLHLFNNHKGLDYRSFLFIEEEEGSIKEGVL